MDIICYELEGNQVVPPSNLNAPFTTSGCWIFSSVIYLIKSEP